MIAGIIALACLAATSGAHVCAGGSCHGVWLPTCLLSGVASGVVIGKFAGQQERKLQTLATAGVIAATMGNCGCCCVGRMGLAALIAGLAVTAVSVKLRGRLRMA